MSKLAVMKDEDKIRMFKEHTIKRYNLNREIIVTIQDLKELLDFRKKAPMEFVRRENFVVCSSGYNTKTINIQKIKYAVEEVKSLMKKINSILKNGF